MPTVLDITQRVSEKLRYKYRQVIFSIRKFAVTFENGLKHWFTRILYPFVEPANNIAERALRELVVMKKIIGTWRNTKGTEITETVMTMIRTWQQRGLDTYSMMRNSI